MELTISVLSFSEPQNLQKFDVFSLFLHKDDTLNHLAVQLNLGQARCGYSEGRVGGKELGKLNGKRETSSTLF